MDFLEKLNVLMERDGLNKRTLSIASGIPYTTIDGWYKCGYDGLRLATVRKLADYFKTDLDFWARDEIELPGKERRILESYRENPESQWAVDKLLDIN